jgi:hypothetical protein
MIDPARLDRFERDVLRTAFLDVQEIVCEIHEEYNEVPAFVLLYVNHNLGRAARAIADVMIREFPDDAPPFTFAFYVISDGTKTTISFIEGPDITQKLERIKPFSDPMPRKFDGNSVFVSKYSKLRE